MSKIIGSENGTCRLCGGPGPLCASHIVPEFLYKPMYTTTGPRHFFILSTEAEKPERTLQKGFREYLLCKKCEVLFSAWENVARQFYFGDLAKGLTETSKNVLLFENLPYAELKNLWNSLFWRLGVTSVPNLRGVELGEHEATLRAMLLRADPGEPVQFGCLLMRLRFMGKCYQDIMRQPHMVDDHFGHAAALIVGGISHCFYLPEIQETHPLRHAALQHDGHLIMGVVDVEHIPALKEIFVEYGQAMHSRRSQS